MISPQPAPLLCASLVFVAAAFSGCVRNACEHRSAEAQIDVILRHPLPEAAETAVSLRINDNAPLVRHFAFRGSLSFVFEFGALDRPPRQLTIEVVVHDARRLPTATGSLRTGFVSNGCNFFAVEVLPLDRDSGPADSFPQLSPDAARAEIGPLDGLSADRLDARDGPLPDRAAGDHHVRDTAGDQHDDTVPEHTDTALP